MPKKVTPPKPKAKAEKKLGKAVKAAIPSNTDSTIQRKGYVLHFLEPNQAKEMNDLIGTGKVVDTVAISCATNGDKIDELIYVVKD